MEIGQEESQRKLEAFMARKSGNVVAIVVI
jgi:hypothetical protein